MDVINEGDEDDDIGYKDIYFKVVYTSNSKIYKINPLWSTIDFMNIMKTRIINDFGFTHFELVEAGQNVPLGQLSEEAPALILNHLTLASKYGDDMRVAFYIRCIHT